MTRPEDDPCLTHLAVVGDTYMVLISSRDTGGAYTLMDMLIPPSAGGPPLHRHDYEEMYYMLEGEITFNFRGELQVLRAGDAINIPANAPHAFFNPTAQPARFLCMVPSAKLEAFFANIGMPMATRTTPAPPLSEAEQGEFIQKALASGARNSLELVPPS